MDACATYGIDEVTVETSDAIHTRTPRARAGRSSVASPASRKQLEEAEADEEKHASRLDDLLHQLGFRDGTLDARAGALDWAVERAAERTAARMNARPRREIEDDLTRLQDEARRLRRPEWATVQPSDAEGPDIESLVSRQIEIRAMLESETERGVSTSTS